MVLELRRRGDFRDVDDLSDFEFNDIYLDAISGSLELMDDTGPKISTLQSLIDQQADPSFLQPQVHNSQSSSWAPFCNEGRILGRGDDLIIASWNLFFSVPAAAARTSAAIAYLRTMFGQAPHNLVVMFQELRCKLAALAVRIFGTIANSVPSERSFSAINFLHSKARNRLTPANADKLAIIYMNERLLERIAQSQNQPLGHHNEANSTVISWKDLTEDGWLTLEDTYMDIHCASSLDVDAVIGEFTHQPASDGEETIVDKFEDQDGSEIEETGGN